MLTYATTFSGIGGWEIGLNACGWELKWQCERDRFCQALLKQRFGVPIYDDIKTLLDEQPEPVDALIGSPPCQPFSNAGKRRGTSDERHLYPAFIRAVGVLQPRWVLMEQVPAILNDELAFGEYVGGLAALGYDIVWHCIPACSVGAFHRRERLWIIAYSDGKRVEGDTKKQVLRKPGVPVGEISIPFQENERLYDTFESRLCRSIYGIPNGVDRIKALGNAVVPQIPYIIGQAINQIENSI